MVICRSIFEDNIMTTKGEWVAYTGSGEQIAEMVTSKNGFIVKANGEEWSGIFTTDTPLMCHLITHYWIIPDDPLRKMKIRQAMTGQPVWQRYQAHRFEWDSSLGNVMVDYIKTEVTTTPNWNIQNAEYSFTSFEE